ncbi:hypothetical protein FACS189485_16840 [Spirochaetia bacterium]|nr:hypothetical protein FACS189485_16840 [Spirochaetia bacterium]
MRPKAIKIIKKLRIFIKMLDKSKFKRYSDDNVCFLYACGGFKHCKGDVMKKMNLAKMFFVGVFIVVVCAGIYAQSSNNEQRIMGTWTGNFDLWGIYGRDGLTVLRLFLILMVLGDGGRMVKILHMEFLPIK